MKQTLFLSSLCMLSLALAGRLAAQSTINYEAESLTYTPNGATASVQTDTNSSGGKWVQLAGNSVGDYIDFAIPSIPAGTYQLQMEWKGNTGRGILQLSVDGTNLGGTLDQYSAAQSYPTTTFGTLTFGSATTHTIRLTVTGKNSASSGYQLSADKFTFTGQSGGQVSAPVFSPGGGTYGSTQNVTMTSDPGASIRYTTDSSTPTETHGTVYSGAVNVPSTITLKAIGYAAGLTDSTVTSATYTISSGPGKPNGNPILPPKWAFGVMFGSYDDQATVLNDVTQLRTSYCGDLIWVDSSWLSSNYNGPPQNYIDFKFDGGQFPHPDVMISTLHSKNFHFGVWQWPWIDKSNSLYSTGANKTNHYFIEDSSGNVVNGGGWHGVTFTGQFDLSSDASATWWKGLNKPLFDMGFDFLKMDTTVGIPTNGVLVNGSKSSNDWRGFYHQRAWEITAAAQLAQGRGFLLAHSDTGGATNNDQYPGLWTGDSSSTFSSLVSKDMGGGFKCNTKTSAAYWCGDTGGYNGTSNDELYQRWLQYGCFTPLTEFFGAKNQKGSNNNIGRFPWCFSAAAATTFSHYTQLRYQLLPFRYSNAQACYHVTGGSVQYPVTWPNNKQIINGHGSSEILVQPVTTAGAGSASVTFPESSSTVWLDYTPYSSSAPLNPNTPSGKSYKGGASATITAPTSQVPLFVKAGSIIPMLVPYNSDGSIARQNYVDEKPASQLTLDIYPSGSTSYSFYEDDGISDLYITGNEYSTTLFSSNNTSGKEVVTIGAASGSFAGQFANRTYYLKINQQTATPAGVSRDGTAITTKATSFAALVTASGDSWYYDSAADIVWVKFSTPTSASTSVSLQ